MDETLNVYTLDRRPDLEAQLDQLNAGAWPEFMLHGGPLGWDLLFTTFADCQILICDAQDQLLAFGHTVPFRWDGSLADLPSTIRDIISRAKEGHRLGAPPNTFSALAAVVDERQQGRGLSSRIIEEMRSLAARRGCASLVAPVRPTWKSRYPLIPMETYAAWRRPDGLPFDPWLRVHARLGARIMMVAPSTLRVTGTVAEWEAWTGMAFPGTGLHLVPGALQPVVIDREADRGVYDDPNVWMRHPVWPLPAGYLKSAGSHSASPNRRPGPSAHASQRLLGHPNGGALAVVGHVEPRVGPFLPLEGAERLTTVESALTRLLGGDRAGYAREHFNNRFGESVPAEELATPWTANSDASSYVVLGDAAVGLCARLDRPLSSFGAICAP